MSQNTQDRPVVPISPVVDEVILFLHDQVEGAELALVEKFVRLFLARAPSTLLKERSIENLGRMALGAFHFLKASSPDQVNVEILNPDEDSEGWYAPVTVLRTSISERSFVVDTIREFLHSQDLSLETFIYPLLTVERDEDGAMIDIRPSVVGDDRESLVHAEVARVVDTEVLTFVKEETERRLHDVVSATDDFELMVDRVSDVVSDLGIRMRDVPKRKEEFHEIQAFMRWLRDGAFVFLGYRAYSFVPETEGGELIVSVESGSGLGVLRDEDKSSFAHGVPIGQLPSGMRERAIAGPLLIISKTNAESTVHRRARMDYIGVKRLAPDGSVIGEHRFLGLFTSRVYSEAARDIPILRQKLKAILERSAASEGSHDYKEIITIFDTMPKEELFLASEEEIEYDVRKILTRYHTEGVTVSVRQDPLQRGVSILVVLPRGRFSSDVRREFEAALVKRYDGEVLNYHLALGAGDQARLHFYMAAPPERLAEVAEGELESIVSELTRTWTDEVREGLAKRRAPDDARRLAQRYSKVFSAEYQAATEPATTVNDILELEAMRLENRMQSLYFRQGAGADATTELRVYLREQKLILSDFMPILENCGLRVIAVSPFVMKVRDDEKEPSSIYTFEVQGHDGASLNIEERERVLAEAILAVRRGDATDDGFNRMVQETGMAWREVEVIRSYARYVFQLGAVPSRLSIRSALEAHPEVGKLFFDLFVVRFDPAWPGVEDDRQDRADEIREEITAALQKVSSLPADRALRALGAVVEATVRTNYFSRGGKTPTHRSGGVPYISFKFDCALLQGLSKSRLLYEVWVRSSRMEGIHLRGARVARGGIRYSDRPEDFRTEVLGLVNTQMVKNAVIVPGGSKGGFVTLRSFTDREAMGEEAKEQYRTLVRGLLDITDNLNGKSVSPEGVVCYDEPDPYLVVAADKGTATFSDEANAIAAEYGFWLDDAFASGGSNGYDHKAVGITAGGAWECVRRHFREMGKDIQTDHFTVAGIGDMSGDVFGNGMLLSPAIRLVAAFDHRHVFIDPDPDPETTYAERKRMFALGRSSWEDYDQSLLSKGGMIVPRGAKSVELSPEARAALGMDPEGDPLDGESLIRAVLSAPVELLWNGGIGTYVKAASQVHAEAGDPSNDAVRINVSELRAAVIGEGGNLGLTQEARIEYALGGGRINTDALDNSGGVDLSDREVNLKILLNEVVKTGDLDSDGRNQLLEELTDTVAELVLEDSRSQSLAISLDEYRARRGVDDFKDLMADLAKTGLLDRDDEGLPTWEELEERLTASQSLTRPELSVLLAYAKLHLKLEILDSELPDDPATARYFFEYFPERAIDQVGVDRATNHRLRREVTATQLTNDLVNLMGSTFIVRVARETGHGPAEVARAWLVASNITRHGDLIETIRGKGTDLPVAVAYRWTLGLARVLERTTRWLLDNSNGEESTEELIARSLEGLEALRGQFASIVHGEDRDVFLSRVAEVKHHGVDEGFAEDFITLRFLDQLLEIYSLARAKDADPIDTAKVYYSITADMNIPWLIRCIDRAGGGGRWESRWALGLVSSLTEIRRAFTGLALEGGLDWDGTGSGPNLEDRLKRFRELLEEIQGEERVGLAGLSVAVREARHLADRILASGKNK